MTVTDLRIVALCIWFASVFLMFTTGWNVVGHIILSAILGFAYGYFKEEIEPSNA